MILDDMKYLACALPEGVLSYKYAGFFDREIEYAGGPLAAGQVVHRRVMLKCEEI